MAGKASAVLPLSHVEGADIELQGSALHQRYMYTYVQVHGNTARNSRVWYTTACQIPNFALTHLRRGLHPLPPPPSPLELHPVVHQCHLLISAMVHFISQLQYYINFEVLHVYILSPVLYSTCNGVYLHVFTVCTCELECVRVN